MGIAILSENVARYKPDGFSNSFGCGGMAQSTHTMVSLIPSKSNYTSHSMSHLRVEVVRSPQHAQRSFKAPWSLY